MLERSRFFVCALAVAFAPAAIVLNAQTAAPTPPDHSWSVTASYALKETVDGNVFLQDLGETARKQSLVTSVTPGVALGYQRTPVFKAVFSYAPEVTRFHSYASENNVAHRASLNFNGKSGGAAWELTNSLVRFDGNSQGPTFNVVDRCDIPALGGIPLRDRRDAVIWRNGFRLTQTMGRWFLRPTFTSYVHDFRTEQRARTGAYAGYENYVDRYELNGGADLGYGIGKKTWIVAGHRYGHQEQGKLLGVESLYSSSYNRVLLGVEGAPKDWLKVNVLAGPDFRRFKKRAAGFDPDEMLWFINASASWLPTRRNTFTVTLTRCEQPAFSSHSVYEDIVYDFAWRRQFTKRLSGSAGFRVYGGDWQAPVYREDWIYTPSASLSYTMNQHLIAEVAYTHDSVTSRVPNTPGREFERRLFFVSLRGSF